jgi:hypothetical protein
MPQLLRIGPYILYFWSNENLPLEPIHVHITEGTASANATKIWITSSGKALICNNNSRIPERILNRLLRVIEANSAEFMQIWKDHFGEISYYC